MLARLLVDRGSGDGRLVFVGGFGRFEDGIHDQIEDVGEPLQAGLTLEDGLAQALAVDDAAVAAEVAEGGFLVEHVF